MAGVDRRTKLLEQHVSGHSAIPMCPPRSRNGWSWHRWSRVRWCHRKSRRNSLPPTQPALRGGGFRSKPLTILE
jgi:hypothetical protein